MNHKRQQWIMPIWILIGLLLVGCAGRATPVPNLLNPQTETLASNSENPNSNTEAEPNLRPSATLAPPPPTRTPYPSPSPIPTISFPQLSGDYLGQELPGLTPVLFAPGIVSTGLNVRNIAFSPDGSELYFTAANQKLDIILWMRQVDGVWMQPEVAPFSGKYSDRDPCFSPDGQRLFFASDRPVEGEGDAQIGYRLFFMEKAENGWSSPQSVGEAINQGSSQYEPSVAADGTLYFTATYADGEGFWDLYRSRLVNETYQTPENLGTTINEDNYEYAPYIAPDQSFLLFSHNGAPYYSLQQANGTWTEPRSLSNELSITNYVWGAALSPDGNTVFIATSILPSPKLPSMPPGFDLVREVIGDDQKTESLFKQDYILGIYLNIYWVSSAVLPFLED